MFKVNHLGKVKTSLMLAPETLEKARIQAIRLHMTLGEVMENSLEEYCRNHTKTWEESVYQKIQSDTRKRIERQRLEREKELKSIV